MWHWTLSYLLYLRLAQNTIQRTISVFTSKIIHIHIYCSVDTTTVLGYNTRKERRHLPGAERQLRDQQPTLEYEVSVARVEDGGVGFGVAEVEAVAEARAKAERGRAGQVVALFFPTDVLMMKFMFNIAVISWMMSDAQCYSPSIGTEI